MSGWIEFIFNFPLPKFSYVLDGLTFQFAFEILKYGLENLQAASSPNPCITLPLTLTLFTYIAEQNNECRPQHCLTLTIWWVCSSTTTISLGFFCVLLSLDWEYRFRGRRVKRYCVPSTSHSRVHDTKVFLLVVLTCICSLGGYMLKSSLHSREGIKLHLLEGEASKTVIKCIPHNFWGY